MPADYSVLSSGTDTTWYNWVDGTTDNSSTWATWCDDSSTNGITYGSADFIPCGSNAAPAVDPEVAERQRLEQERRERERLEARDNANRLLRVCLTEEQQRQLDEHASFLLRSERERLYRIRRGSVRNVDELDEDGNVVARYCIHPLEAVPDYDTMLAQKLMLETDEAAFLRIANRSAA